MPFHPKDSPSGDPGPTTIEIPGKTALLLVALAQQLGARSPGEVVAHALGLLQTVQSAKARGCRIVVRDPATGRDIDLAL
jgi:hypothetical protein